MYIAFDINVSFVAITMNNHCLNAILLVLNQYKQNLIMPTKEIKQVNDNKLGITRTSYFSLVLFY